jgi:uncharacterized protein YceK
MKKAMIISAGLLLLSGCAAINTRTGIGFINMHREAGQMTDNTDAQKEGRACSTNIMGLYVSGDSSIDAARRAGRVVKVSTVDYDISNFAFLYGQVCTIVRGN